MKKILLLSCLFATATAHAQTAPAPTTPQAPAPTTARPGTPTTATKPAPAIPQATTGRVATPVPAPAMPVAPAPLTPEQRRQQELLANAERIDRANRELLARNQELQVQNENLSMQNNVIRRDKSSEGIWKGALAVIVGFLMGWFFSSGSSSRRKSSW
jgi:hypothetical protein